jgi:TatD DNase family protein
MYKITDSHFHILNMEKKGVNISALLDRIFNGFLEYGIDISVDAEQIDRRLEISEKYPGLYLSIGFGPAYVLNENWKADLEKINRYVKYKKIIAVGETGLDWHWNYGTKEKQIELFESQLYLADKHRLPVVIHNRKADMEIEEALKRIKPGRGGIIHCFSSDYDFASSMLDLGFYISFAGNLTFKNAHNLHETACKLPLNRILLETDSPYLSPVPLRGKINTPENIHHTYSYFAELRKIPVDDAARKISENFKRLFLKNGV